MPSVQSSMNMKLRVWFPLPQIMCVSIRTNNMQSALFASMKPRQVVHFRGAFGGPFAVLFEVQIDRKIFNVIKLLIPLIEWLDVNPTHIPVPLLAQNRYQPAPNESACTSHQNF